MPDTITWEKTMERALERVGVENKAILVFFHNPA
jgi:hypothetical protein